MQTTAYAVPIHQLLDTQYFAGGLAEAVLTLPQQAITIALNGSLGTGKTQWCRYFCIRLGVPEEAVTSPTYVLLQRYVGLRTVHHLDWYRLRSAAEVWDLGLDELLERPGIVLIEWADRFPECLPEQRLEIQWEHAPSHRMARVQAFGPTSMHLLEQLLVNTSGQLEWQPEAI